MPTTRPDASPSSPRPAESSCGADVAGRRRPVGGLLLTHGAGGHKDQPALVAIDEGLAPLPVERMNFPYRDLGPKRPPDRAPKLLASVTEHAAAFCVEHHIAPGRLALGGRSMGG